MTAATAHARNRRAPPLQAIEAPPLQAAPPAPRPVVNWTAAGVLMALLVHAAAAVWFASSLDRRVTNIEQQLPAGAIARLDERTAQMSRTLDRLDQER